MIYLSRFEGQLFYFCKYAWRKSQNIEQTCRKTAESKLIMQKVYSMNINPICEQDFYSNMSTPHLF